MSTPANYTRVPLVEPENLPPDIQRENEYGTLDSTDHLYQVKQRNGEPLTEPVVDTPPYYISLLTYLNYLLLLILGHMHDFLGMTFQKSRHLDLLERDGLAPWYSNFESFYVRRIKMRIDDCFSRPTTGVPGRFIRCIDRISHDINEYFTYSGAVYQCMNLSSYNYLGLSLIHI